MVCRPILIQFFLSFIVELNLIFAKRTSPILRKDSNDQHQSNEEICKFVSSGIFLHERK